MKRFYKVLFVAVLGLILIAAAVDVKNSGMKVDNGRLLNPVGTAALPGIILNGDPNTGIYQVAPDDLGISTGGTLRFDCSTTQCTSTLPIHDNIVGLGSISTTYDESRSGVVLDNTTISTAATPEQISPSMILKSHARDTDRASGTDAGDDDLWEWRMVDVATSAAVTSSQLRFNVASKLGAAAQGNWAATAPMTISNGGTVSVSPGPVTVDTPNIQTTDTTAFYAENSYIATNALPNQNSPNLVFWGSLYTGGHSYGNKYRIFYQASDGTLNFQRSINTDGGGYGAWAQHLTLLPTQAVTISNTLTLSSGVVSIPGGTSTGPTYTFTGDTDTGLSAQTANTLIASAGGVTVGTFTTSGLTVMGGASYGGGSAHTTVTGISTADATATVLWTSAAVGVGDSITVSARCVMVDVDSGAGDVGSDWIVGTFDKGAAGTLAVTSSLTTLHTKKKAGIATDHYSCTIRACTGVGAPDALCTVADTAQITCLNSGHSVHGAANMKCYVESTVLNDGV